MSTSETTVTGRCETHPGRPAVGRCEACGRLLCIGCAIPVRGQVLGPECVAGVLGPDVAPDAATPPRRPRRPGLNLSGLGFLGALVASALPWSNQFSSHESGFLGGWGFSPLAWSLAAALGSVAGLVLWALMRRKNGPGRMARRALMLLAVLVAGGAVLYLVAPPPFSHPWVGPWAALGSAAAAVGGTAWDTRRARRAVG